jgi:YVTN family beta-propeller protein
MEFRILGPLEVVRDGRALPLGSGRQLALVALLLLHANEVVSVDRLVDELWGESPPPTAAKIVRNSVSLLRRQLGERLVTKPPGYRLYIERGELDSERLEAAVQSGDLEELNEALALWRGPPLAQFAYEPFAQEEISRLEELRLAAIEAQVEAQLEQGRHREALGQLEALVREYPLRERLCGQLMLAHYRSGEQAKALETYRQIRRRLDEELGIEPGPPLRKLERKILNQDESLAAPVVARTEMPPARRRALWVVVVGTLVLLAAAASAAFVATRHSGHGLGQIRPNHVGLIDPKTNEVVAEIPVGIRPGPVAAGAGSVWVGNLVDRDLTRIDPRRRMAIGTISLGNRTPTGLAVGAGFVWVAHGLRGELTRVEPEFGGLERIQVATRPLGAPLGSVAIGTPYVWAAYGDSTLARIEPGSLRRSGSALTGTSPAAVVVGGGAIWVANSGEATVQRFDPSTFEEGPIPPRIHVGRQPSALAYWDGAVWIACRGDDVVERLDPRTNSLVPIPVGDAPVALAVGAGAVWVTNSADGTVSRIDPATKRVVRTIEVGNRPGGMAFADSVVWVASQGR